MTVSGDVTHYRWACPRCGNETWLPKGAIGDQADHAERPFCGCEDQGVRMGRIDGENGRLRL